MDRMDAGHLVAALRTASMDNPPVGVDHYENFPVASRLCPARLRPAVVAIYRFARTADDLADEGDAPAERRLADLLAYRAELRSMHAGEAISSRWAHVFAPLRQASTDHGLPITPFEDLLSAFEQDVVKHAYRRSLGAARLLPSLGQPDRSPDAASPRRRRRAEALQQSDAICTALQLANFWQDLSVDTAARSAVRPGADCTAHRRRSGGSAATPRDDPGTAPLLAELWTGREQLMLRGAPLACHVPGAPAGNCALVVQGGLRILEKIERQALRCSSGVRSCAATTRRCCCWRAVWHEGLPAGTGEEGSVTPQEYVQDKAAAERLELLLRLPVPAAAAARARSPRSTPSAAKSTTWWTKSATPASRAAKLAWWRAESRQSFAGKPSHPVMQALMPHAAAFGISAGAPARRGRRLRDGPRADRATSTFPALERYCHLVAGVVGEVSANIFGRTEAAHGRLRAHGSASRCSSPTSSATSATTRAAAASTCRWRTCSGSTSRRRRS